MIAELPEARAIKDQLVEIPIDLLRLISASDIAPVGRRSGRKSLGANVHKDGEFLFHVHFDGSDGKCQIRNLKLSHCKLLKDWDLQINR